MNFLLISHAYAPDPGAAASRTETIAKALKMRGHNVTVLAGRPYYPEGKVPKKYQRRFSKKEGDVIRVWVPALATKGLWRRAIIYTGFMLSYWLAIFNYGELQNFHAVYYVSPYPLSVFSLPAILHGRIIGAKVLLDCHDLWPEIITENAKIPGLRSILKVMTVISSRIGDKVVPISEAQKKGLIEFGVNSEKIEIVGLAVDTDYFSPYAPIARAVSGNPIICAYIGTLAPRYDFDTMEKAAKMLPDIDFIVQGDGEQADMVAKMNSLKLERGFVDRDIMLSRLRSADILLCTIKESIEANLTSVPTKVLEYMAVGKPVICTANREIDRLGIETVCYADPERLAMKIRNMVASNMQSVGIANRNTVIQRFSLHALGQRIEEISK